MAFKKRTCTQTNAQGWQLIPCYKYLSKVSNTNVRLTHFQPMLHFYTPWKLQKTSRGYRSGTLTENDLCCMFCSICSNACSWISEFWLAHTRNFDNTRDGRAKNHHQNVSCWRKNLLNRHLNFNTLIEKPNEVSDV